MCDTVAINEKNIFVKFMDTDVRKYLGVNSPLVELSTLMVISWLVVFTYVSIKNRTTAGVPQCTAGSTYSSYSLYGNQA